MNVLFTSSGRRGYMIRFAKEILGNTGRVYAANSSDKVSSFLFADETVVTPLIYSDDYIPFILDYCVNNSINMIIPLFDIDAEKIAKHRDTFEKSGIKAIVSNYDKVKICNDKWLTYRFLSENSIPCPKTFIDQNTLFNAIDSGLISFPIVIKPRWGMGSIGIYFASNRMELSVLAERVKKEAIESYIRYFDEMDADQSVLYQEFIEGQEYGIDVMNDTEGNHLMTVPKLKMQMRAGETDSAIVINDAKLKELGNRLSRIMYNRGNLDVDVVVRDNKAYVIEMNARFGGGYPFSHKAGANLLGYIITDKKEFIPVSENLEYNVEMYKDISIVGCVG